MNSEQIFYDPDKHPTDTLKSFKEFCTRFELRYNAQFPDPPTTAMDSAIQRWKLLHTTTETPNPVPTADQYDLLKAQWKAKDKVAKVLGLFSSPRLYTDWEIAQPDEDNRNNAHWREFKNIMETFYQPTANLTLTNYQFRYLTQSASETFPSFCNRVETEAKSCSFKCTHLDCSAETTAIRDQIVIGTINTKIREEALLRSWNLATLRTEGMKIESACRGDAEISGDKGAVNKVGKYSFSNLKNRKSESKKYSESEQRSTCCFNCAEYFKGPAFKHKEVCKAKDHRCRLCGRKGHLPKCCRSVKQVDHSDSEQEADCDRIDDVYNVNIFKVNTSNKTENMQQHNGSKSKNPDFLVEVLINGCIATVTADTGARVSVCGKAEAVKWNLMSRMVASHVRIKPYKSPAVETIGMARCSVWAELQRS